MGLLWRVEWKREGGRMEGGRKEEGGAGYGERERGRGRERRRMVVAYIIVLQGSGLPE